MARVRTRRSRARLALAACALWLAGVEVMPALHEAVHDHLAPHSHAAGSIVTVSFEDTTHRHPDGSIHFVDPHGAVAKRAAHPRHRPPGDRAIDATALADHAGGLAHHAAALAPVAPPIITPLPIDRRSITLALERVVRPPDCLPPTAIARGPPLVA